MENKKVFERIHGRAIILVQLDNLVRDHIITFPSTLLFTHY